MYKIRSELVIRKRSLSDYALTLPPKPRFGNAMNMMRAIRSGDHRCEEAFRIFRRNPRLFSLDELETQFLNSLLNKGYAIAPAFFSKELVDRVYARADGFFHNERCVREITLSLPREPSTGGRYTTHERTTGLIDPLVSIPDVLDIAFHESLLKIAAHFFLHIPRSYKVSVVRHFPNHRPKCFTFQGANEESGSLNIMIDLLDIDDSRGPFVYVPGVYNCMTLDRRSLGASGVSECAPAYVPNQEKISSRSKWMVLRAERGSIVAVPGSGSSGSIWTYPADVNNKPRTTIMIQTCGYRSGDRLGRIRNRILKWNFDRMTSLQQLFAFPEFVDGPIPGLVKAGQP